MKDYSDLYKYTEKTFLRSGGPGGQNVNKRETKVRLVFDFLKTSFSPEEKNRLLRKYPTGFVVVTCDTTRSQRQNTAMAFDELKQRLRDALFIPKLRKKTISPCRTKRGKEKKRLKSHLMKYRRKAELS